MKLINLFYQIQTSGKPYESNYAFPVNIRTEVSCYGCNFVLLPWRNISNNWLLCIYNYVIFYQIETSGKPYKSNYTFPVNTVTEVSCYGCIFVLLPSRNISNNWLLCTYNYVIWLACIMFEGPPLSWAQIESLTQKLLYFYHWTKLFSSSRTKLFCFHNLCMLDRLDSISTDFISIQCMYGRQNYLV